MYYFCISICEPLDKHKMTDTAPDNVTKPYNTTTGRCWVAMRLLQNHIQAEIQKKHKKINVEQLLLLMELDYEDGQRPSVLAERMLRSKGTITSLIRHAQQSEYIASTADPKNRNAKRLFLTLHGKKTLDELAPIVNNALAECLDHVPDENIGIVNDAMNGIIRKFNPEWFEFEEAEKG